MLTTIKGQAVKHEPSPRPQHLRQALAHKAPTVVPGVVDAATARLLELNGFRIGIFPGSIAALSLAAQPDEGLITSDQLIRATRRISTATVISLLVDIDNGYGNLQHTTSLAEELAQSNIAGVILEDGIIPPPAVGPSVHPPEDIAEKIRAIKSIFGSSGPVLVARTNARPTFPMQDCIDRLSRYKDAGADAVFLFRPTHLDDLQAIRSTIKLPQIAVLPKTHPHPRQLLEELTQCAVKIALAPSVCYLAALSTFNAVLVGLKDNPCPLGEEEHSFQEALIKRLTRR